MIKSVDGYTYMESVYYSNQLPLHWPRISLRDYSCRLHLMAIFPMKQRQASKMSGCCGGYTAEALRCAKSRSFTYQRSSWTLITQLTIQGQARYRVWFTTMIEDVLRQISCNGIQSSQQAGIRAWVLATKQQNRYFILVLFKPSPGQFTLFNGQENVRGLTWWIAGRAGLNVIGSFLSTTCKPWSKTFFNGLGNLGLTITFLVNKLSWSSLWGDVVHYTAFTEITTCLNSRAHHGNCQGSNFKIEGILWPTSGNPGWDFSPIFPANIRNTSNGPHGEIHVIWYDQTIQYFPTSKAY